MASKEVRASLKEIQDNLLCSICLEMVAQPASTPCAHTFCQLCIERAITSAKKPKCPLCKKKISKRGLQENMHLKMIVEAVKGLEAAIIMDTGEQDWWRVISLIFGSCPNVPLPNTFYAHYLYFYNQLKSMCARPQPNISSSSSRK